MKKYDSVVVGEIYVDHVMTGFMRWPEPGEEAYAREYVQELGGGAAITACALARLERKVSLIGIVGENELPWIEHRLSEFGVSCAGLRSASGRTGVTVSISSQVERSFFTYLGENAKLEAQLTDDALIEHMAEAQHVHFAMPITPQMAEVLLGRLNGLAATTSLDVGHHATWLRNPDNLRICSKLDYLFPNEREARIICDGNPQDYLEYTRSHHWPNGVVKMGAGGAMMRAGDGILRDYPPDVQTIDTTGAGDAFNAGFIDGLLDGADGQECLRRGCVCGGLSTRVAGALRGLPTREELKKYLQECYG